MSWVKYYKNNNKITPWMQTIWQPKGLRLDIKTMVGPDVNINAILTWNQEFGQSFMTI